MHQSWLILILFSVKFDYYHNTGKLGTTYQALTAPRKGTCRNSSATYWRYDCQLMELFLISLALCCKTLVAAITSSINNKRHVFIFNFSMVKQELEHTSFASLIWQFHQHGINFTIRHFSFCLTFTVKLSSNRQSCKELKSSVVSDHGIWRRLISRPSVMWLAETNTDQLGGNFF